MKKLRVLFIGVSTLIFGVVIGRLSAPLGSRDVSVKALAPDAVRFDRSIGRSNGKAEEAPEPAVRVLLHSQPVRPDVPSFPYDTSVPLRRQVGETVMMTRADSWRDAGRATLADALQTQFWAIAGGDVAKLAEGIVLDDAAKEIITKLRANAPPAVRAEYSSPESFTALLLASNFRNLRGFTADRQRPMSDSETMATVSTIADGQDRFHTHIAHFRKGPDGNWRRVVNGKTAASMVLAHALGELPK